MEKIYDLVVIGSGPGGYIAAIKAAEAGMKVAVVEKGQIGGTCLNRGCIPTKALLHAANLYREALSFSTLGLRAEEIHYDISAMHRHKEAIIEKQQKGIAYLFKSNNIDYIEGSATIMGEHSIRISQESPGKGEIDPQEIIEAQTDKILIATGSKAFKPSLPGFDLPGVLTSDDLLTNTDEIYKKLLIIGGGVIGVEFSMLYNALGCQVTIVEAMERLLPTMDPEISQNLSAVLKKRGIKIHTSALVSRISENPTPDAEGEADLTCIFNAGKEERIAADAILVAIGRRPNTDGLLGENLLLDMKEGAIVVDETLRTSAKSIYAIGDVIGGIQLAHAASAQAICAVEQMLSQKPSVNLSLIPGCVYTDPEIACVGMTSAEAAERGIKIIIGKCQTLPNAKSIIDHQDRGFVKLVFSEETRQIIGAQLMCGRATDLISELTLAIASKTTAEQLASIIRPHPTYSEMITEAAKAAIS